MKCESGVCIILIFQPKIRALTYNECQYENSGEQSESFNTLYARQLCTTRETNSCNPNIKENST